MYEIKNTPPAPLSEWLHIPREAKGGGLPFHHSRYVGVDDVGGVDVGDDDGGGDVGGGDVVTMAKHLDTITICSSQPGVEETPKALSNGSAKGDSAEVRGGLERHYHPHLEPQHHQHQQ